MTIEQQELLIVPSGPMTFTLFAEPFDMELTHLVLATYNPRFEHQINIRKPYAIAAIFKLAHLWIYYLLLLNVI